MHAEAARRACHAHSIITLALARLQYIVQHSCLQHSCLRKAPALTLALFGCCCRTCRRRHPADGAAAQQEGRGAHQHHALQGVWVYVVIAVPCLPVRPLAGRRLTLSSTAMRVGCTLPSAAGVAGHGGHQHRLRHRHGAAVPVSECKRRKPGRSRGQAVPRSSIPGAHSHPLEPPCFAPQLTQ